ncbi:MAG: hypothetical protein BWX65_00242 [Bacteroidetes bacterium ADurb.Bin057]|nr:MAG: hypothetical protein BWX65_00242 [Bacteroidetes bacterium ADurb.Bin057]
MKKLFTFMVAVFLTATLWAQSPEKMSYQAVIRNSSEALVTNTTVGMQISILQGSASGTAVYVETQSPTTNANGLVSIEIGGGTVVSGNFSTIDWANGPYFIETKTDPAGGTNYTITGTSQLLSVPYALYAANAGTATGGGNFTHYIGEEYGGGVIFHLWKDNAGVEHGLIVALTDQSTSQAWSNVTSAEIGTSAQSSWDGLSNSNSIVGQAGHTSSAAKLCLDLVSGGQSDWYLPSIQELNMLWNNYYTVSRALSQISGATQLSKSVYWSSSESSNIYAWSFYFSYGDSNLYSKYNTNYVRAVRAF